MRRLVFLLFGCAALAADLGPELLKASRKGQAEKAQSLAARGAPVESRDKNGRTALMLAAERGHAAVVKVLLSRGAKTDARDREGWTAYGLALFSGETGRAEVLKLLPAPPRGRITLEIEWGSENLYSSCFLSPAQLSQHVGALHPDTGFASALGKTAGVSTRRLLEITGDADADAVLKLRLRPGASCLTQQTADQLSMATDARLIRTRDGAEILVKTFGGGLKGMHVRAVRSPAQYQPLYEEWAKLHAAQVYEAAVEAWLKAPGSK